MGTVVTDTDKIISKIKFILIYINILVSLIINLCTSVQNEYSLITLITYQKCLHAYTQLLANNLHIYK